MGEAEHPAPFHRQHCLQDSPCSWDTRNQKPNQRNPNSVYCQLQLSLKPNYHRSRVRTDIMVCCNYVQFKNRNSTSNHTSCVPDGKREPARECPEQEPVPVTASLAPQVLSEWNPMLSRDATVPPSETEEKKSCRRNACRRNPHSAWELCSTLQHSQKRARLTQGGSLPCPSL